MKKLLKIIAAVTCGAVCALSAACTPIASATMPKGESVLLGGAAEAAPLTYDELTGDILVNMRQKTEEFASRFAACAYSASDGAQNMAVSPVSVYIALSLAAECAAGQTRSELLSALGADYAELKTGISYLYRSLSREYTSETFNGKEKVTAMLDLGNSIWLNDGTEVKEDCIKSLSDDYFCNSFSADFKNGNAAANRAVRDFVKECTKGLIDKDFALADDTVFALINTLYLKDVWNTYGNDLFLTTSPYKFTQSDGTEKSLKMLSGYYTVGKAYASQSYKTFYTRTEHGYELKFILPNEGYTLSDVFTAENISAVNAIEDWGGCDEVNKIRYNTRCIFPEFEASYDEDVKDLLKSNFGINAIFDKYACDYSSLCVLPSADYENVYCKEVRHVTTLNVDRTGIEGAAVTVITNSGVTSIGPEYQDEFLDFVVDKSFGFILTDSYGTTLFSGTVNKI